MTNKEWEEVYELKGWAEGLEEIRCTIVSLMNLLEYLDNKNVGLIKEVNGLRAQEDDHK